MLSRKLAVALLGGAMLTGTAIAQTAPPANPAPAKAPAAATAPATATAAQPAEAVTHKWRASRIVGINVFNEQNETLGTINDLLTSESGVIETVIVGVGGFLGVGERLVAIPLQDVKFSMNPLVVRPPTGGQPAAGTTPAPAAETKAAPAPAEKKASASPATQPAPAGAKVTENGEAPDAVDAAHGVRWAPNHAVVNVTRDQLSAMPEFKYTR